jgi:precorrin-6x reductase
MRVREVPAETVITGDVAEDGGVQEVLTLIQSLGLEVVSVRRTSADRHADEQAFRST